MVKVLNFSKKEKSRVKGFLKNFPRMETKTPFEEFRCKIQDCTVTLYHTGKITVQGKSDEQVKEFLLKKLRREGKLLLGFDEAGRSEATGPFVMAGVLGKTEELREVRDSKKVKDVKGKSELASKNSLAQAIISFNAAYIDLLRRKGFTLDEIEALSLNSLTELFKQFEKELSAKADGKRLKKALKEIEFIVGGDDLEPVISAASVTAKNYRNESKDKRKRETWKTKKK